MQSDEVTIRPLVETDLDGVWRALEPVIRAGETYALPRDMTRAEGLAFWTDAAHEVFVAEAGGTLLGTYFLRANKSGGGAHVGNCGYLTDAAARGRGVAALMCAHSLERARTRGFRAMQFNLVISSNETAVRLWQRMGFEIVGTLPGAFAHPALGDVDAFVMYRKL